MNEGRKDLVLYKMKIFASRSHRVETGGFSRLKLIFKWRTRVLGENHKIKQTKNKATATKTEQERDSGLKSILQ